MLTCARQGRYAEAAEDCTAALELDGSYVKARACDASCGSGWYALALRMCNEPWCKRRCAAQALLRRAQAYEKQGELEQLEKAVAGAAATHARSACFTLPLTLCSRTRHVTADYTRVAELSPGHAQAAAKLRAVAPLVDAKREALKAEMMDTLKGFGNSILGKFGLSLDNFKAEQDPSTGSYSIQFVQQGGGGAASGSGGGDQSIPEPLADA
jgi:hypothetical protein